MLAITHRFSQAALSPPKQFTSNTPQFGSDKSPLLQHLDDIMIPTRKFAEWLLVRDVKSDIQNRYVPQFPSRTIETSTGLRFVVSVNSAYPDLCTVQVTHDPAETAVDHPTEDDYSTYSFDHTVSLVYRPPVGKGNFLNRPCQQLYSRGDMTAIGEHETRLKAIAEALTKVKSGEHQVQEDGSLLVTLEG